MDEDFFDDLFEDSSAHLLDFLPAPSSFAPSDPTSTTHSAFSTFARRATPHQRQQRQQQQQRDQLNSDDFYLDQLATRQYSPPSDPAQASHFSLLPTATEHNILNPSPFHPSSRTTFAPRPLSGADLLRRADQLVAGPFNIHGVKRERAPEGGDSRHLSRSGSSSAALAFANTFTTMPRATRATRRTAEPSPGVDSDPVEFLPAGAMGRTPRRRNPPRQVTTPQTILDSDDPFSPPTLQTNSRGPAPLQQRQVQAPADKKRKRDSFDDQEDEKLNLFDDDNIPVVDLVDKDKVPESILEKPKPKNLTKLSAYQCVICMDNVTDLTVTHCGHLFCSECLHSSLHIDLSRKICPICRQKIETRPASGKFNSKQKGFYALELKLMTKESLMRKRTEQQP